MASFEAKNPENEKPDSLDKAITKAQQQVIEAMPWESWHKGQAYMQSAAFDYQSGQCDVANDFYSSAIRLMRKDLPQQKDHSKSEQQFRDALHNYAEMLTDDERFDTRNEKRVLKDRTAAEKLFVECVPLFQKYDTNLEQARLQQQLGENESYLATVGKQSVDTNEMKTAIASFNQGLALLGKDMSQTAIKERAFITSGLAIGEMCLADFKHPNNLEKKNAEQYFKQARNFWHAYHPDRTETESIQEKEFALASLLSTYYKFLVVDGKQSSPEAVDVAKEQTALMRRMQLEKK